MALPVFPLTLTPEAHGLHLLHIGLKDNEEILLAGLRAGDPKVIARFYDNYSAALYGIIFRIVRVDEVAEDILQDTFVKAWKCILHYDPSKGRLFTWLAHMARNLAIDQLRSKYHRNNKDNEGIHDQLAKLEVVYKVVAIKPELIGLRGLTSRLSNEHRDIVDLVYFQGYTHIEAAEQLGIPTGTLKSRLRLAIKLLRKFFT